MAVEESSKIEHSEPNLIGSHSVDLTVIHEATRCIGSEGSSQEAVNKILRLMSEMVGLNRGRVLLPDEATGGLRIRYSYGLTQDQVDKGLYSPGEGITGKVIETGKAVSIPKISEEPLFLDRTATRKKKQSKERSFICVPVKRGKQVIGALSVDRPFDKSYALKSGQKSSIQASRAVNIGKIDLAKV